MTSSEWLVVSIQGCFFVLSINFYFLQIFLNIFLLGVHSDSTDQREQLIMLHINQTFSISIFYVTEMFFAFFTAVS